MDATRPFGLKITLRQQLIAVAYAAVLCSWTMPLLRRDGAEAGLAVARVLLLAAPWLLAALVLVFDRKTPTRDWLVGVLLFAGYPSAVVYLDLAAALDWLDGHALARPGGLVLVNVLTLVATFVFVRKMRPAECPTCGTIALIPLARLTGQSARVNQTRWCSACGRQFWRDARGHWRPERRRTWVDAMPMPAVGAEAETAGQLVA